LKLRIFATCTISLTFGVRPFIAAFPLWPALARTAAKEGKEGDMGESGNKWPHSKGRLACSAYAEHQANRTGRVFAQ
jgi:hypothetical protein